ncbi:semaphorin-6C isoform X1 [Heterocephalus glaber]|uniref:Semaphorin-6C isoform X1 n=1 Tax=Heterocephalus glaber TaxID=10181 RepID=A0AAX6TL21_HETGA|nr:semaphorin-6C isoform X1 [Heterocephalus glaber]
MAPTRLGEQVRGLLSPSIPAGANIPGASPLSWFRGLEEDAVAADLGLDFQRFLTLNRTLLVAARDHIFFFDLQAQEEGEGLVPSKYLTWRSQGVENCAVRGKQTEECYNYIRVLVPRDSQTLLACGTNSFNPKCRSYGITSLQQESKEMDGRARCPFDATQSNVAIFAEGSLYSATNTDFQASDPVVYRSLGPLPLLRTAKHDSKWLREPHFVHALEHGDHIYFFFREVSVEDARLGRVQFSRVARVCKRDMGGSSRALDGQWTSFLKLRLNCSVPGDPTFYFDVLQALTGPSSLHGRAALFGVFTTQTNSIPGSAVCAFYLDVIERGFEGKFKEQRSLDGAWTPVSEDRVPSPRPGSCAGVGGAASFSSSKDLPDDVLAFIKAHPLLDPAVPPAIQQPLLTLTSRALLTQVVVDGKAGLNGNATVLFLGSEDGMVLKVLPPSGRPRPDPILLEEIDAYSPARCSGKQAAQTARRIIGLELDTEGHRLFVAFSGCVISLPVSRCARHGACQRSCLASQDPYCGWHSSRGCVDIRGPGGANVDQAGNQDSIQHDDCQGKQRAGCSGPDGRKQHLGRGLLSFSTSVWQSLPSVLQVASPFTPSLTASQMEPLGVSLVPGIPLTVSPLVPASAALAWPAPPSLCPMAADQHLDTLRVSGESIAQCLAHRRMCSSFFHKGKNVPRVSPSPLPEESRPWSSELLGSKARGLWEGIRWRAGASRAPTWSLSPVLLGPGPSPEAPRPPSDAPLGPQASTLGAHTQGVRRDLPAASPSRSVPVPLLLASVAAAFALGASISGLLVSCACRRAHQRGNKDIETPGLPRPLSLRSLARLHGAGAETPPPAKDSDAAQTPQLYSTFLPPPDGGPPPELACLPTPESTPELPVKHLRAPPAPWEWNQNGNNAKESAGRARGGHVAGGPVPRVLVRPPPPGCPGQAVEVTTLEELLRYLHGPQPPRPAADPAPFAPRALSPEPNPLSRESVPPLRLDVPPDGGCAGRPALSAPAPRLGVGTSRRPPFPTHRAPPALLTRVPSGGASRYSAGPGRHLLYLGRPEGFRGRAPKRVDAEKPPPSPKPPLAVPSGGHFNF